MGRHGLGTMHENGEMFAHLYALNRLIIGGSVFSLRRIHEATWISPDYLYRTEIQEISEGRKSTERSRHSRRQPSIAVKNEDEVEEERDKEEQQNKMQRGFPKG